MDANPCGARDGGADASRLDDSRHPPNGMSATAFTQPSHDRDAASSVQTRPAIDDADALIPMAVCRSAVYIFLAVALIQARLRLPGLCLGAVTVGSTLVRAVVVVC